MAVEVIPIVDSSDPRIAVFRDVRDRDVAGRMNGFIAEGEVVLRVLARTPLYRARSVLLAEKRVPPLIDLISAFAPDVSIYAARQAVMDDIAGFPIHRGVLAYGERPALPSPEILLGACPADAVVLALLGVSNHDNMGGLFRNAAAFGVAGVLVDGACCDPLYRKAIRVSVGGALSVPFARLEPRRDLLGLLLAHGFTPLALSPSGESPLARLARPTRAAVLFGAEGPGLPAEILRHTHTIAIPMAGAFDSLNVATTSGIVLHHLTQAAAPAIG